MRFAPFRSRLIAVLSLAGALAGCSGGLTPENSAAGAGASQKSEPSYCSGSINYPDGVAVTGTAQYQYRAVDTSTGLTGNPQTAGIPYAEVIVLSGSSVVQCGQTGAAGAIALTLPSGAGNYTLKVLSRSDSSKIRVSVLEDYYENAPYALSVSFSVAAGTTNKAIGTLTARARASESAKIEGGAFNILAQIYKANEYLRTTTGNSSFVAPKVSIYWKAGHNPYTYFGGTSPLSFYRPGLSQLFILGGNAGNVSSADTDHFDNSIVLHEYGHFLEDQFARSESPGGSHNGNALIDPRLAWSEGWANFLQAAVLRQENPGWAYYIDTVGFSGDSSESGTGSIAIKVDLTENGATAYHDKVGVAGEGTFREMSISRFLYKTIDSVNVPFAALWSAFAGTDSGGTPVGMGSTQVSFRSVGHYNEFLSNIIAHSHPGLAAGWNTLRDEEKQNADTRDYADKLSRVANNSCAGKTLSPVMDASSKSNQLRSNDFYRFDHNGVSKTISLIYTGGTTAGGKYLDLDLHLYRADYVYQETSAASTGGIVASSARAPALDVGTETITLSSSLPAGRYLINVKAYTYGKTAAQLNGTLTYKLKITQGSTTEDLCPAH